MRLTTARLISRRRNRSRRPSAGSTEQGKQGGSGVEALKCLSLPVWGELRFAPKT